MGACSGNRNAKYNDGCRLGKSVNENIIRDVDEHCCDSSIQDIAKDRACIKVSEKRIAIYEQLFKRLEEATKVKGKRIGITPSKMAVVISVVGMQELVAVFENSEDRNFQKFQIVNDISNQIEEVRSSLQHGDKRLPHIVLQIEEELQKNNKVRTVLSDAQEHGFD